MSNKESRIRRNIRNKLGATRVSSKDASGVRRFTSALGKIGFCNDDGDICLPAQFDSASHYHPEQGVYEVVFRGEKKLLDRNWTERSVQEIAGQTF